MFFGILCTSAGAQNFAEGLGHTGNDVTYTRTHIGSLIWFEWITNFWQYIHVKYHNVVFSIKKQKHLVEVSGYVVTNGRIWEKDRRTTVSEQKQYFNKSCYFFLQQ